MCPVKNQSYTLFSCAPEVSLPELCTPVISICIPKVFLTIRLEKLSYFSWFDHKSDVTSVSLKYLHVLACSESKRFHNHLLGVFCSGYCNIFCLVTQSVLTGHEKQESSSHLSVDTFQPWVWAVPGCVCHSTSAWTHSMCPGQAAKCSVHCVAVHSREPKYNIA